MFYLDIVLGNRDIKDKFFKDIFFISKSLQFVQCFKNPNIHMNHLGIMFKMQILH